MPSVIQTERLLLRELRLADADALAKVLSDPESMKYYPHPFSREEVASWIDRNIQRYRDCGYGLWGVTLKSDGEFIGDCGITLQEIEGRLYPEIGYHLLREYRGKGYATEAARTCIDYAFGVLNFDRVYSYMKSDNLPSRRVAERNGMVFQRVFEKIVHGQRVEDEVLYMLVRTFARTGKDITR
jgi:RimJ/RimL family protein N-acetyltransferase